MATQQAEREKPAVLQHTPTLSTEEIAEALHVDTSSVSCWLKSGKLRGYKLGKVWRVKPVDLATFIEHADNQGGKADVIAHRRTQVS